MSCYCIYVLWYGLAAICSFRPQGSKCIPGAKMSVIANGSNICHRKVPTKQLSHGTKPPTFLTNNDKGIKKGSISSSFSFYLLYSNPLLLHRHTYTATPPVLVTHSPLPTDISLPLSLLAYSYLIYSIYISHAYISEVLFLHS